MPSLSSKPKPKSVVGLDIEAGSIAATELRTNGSVEVVRRGVAPLEPGLFGGGEVLAPDDLGAAIKRLFSEHRLPREVRLGIANQKLAVRTMRLPVLPEGELESAVRFQAQDQIPMPLEQSVLDWQVVGATPEEEGGGIDVVAVAARRDMLSPLVAALRSAGLRPVGIDHSAFAMIRALADEHHGDDSGPDGGMFEATPPTLSYEERMELERSGAQPAAGGDGPTRLESTRLYCHLGDVTNLAVASGRQCRFTRIAPAGVEGIAQRLAERRQLSLEHARQWLVHVGLNEPIELIDGEQEIIAVAREVLAEGAAKLAEELRMSLDYYRAQEGAVMVDEVVACGPGVAVPGLIERLQYEVGLPIRAAHPKALAEFGDAEAARLTLSYGLALEG